ncbi:hypothetical protein METBIDRAFT_42656 [Metschnikowia bicuspidata var. bicuspidata NRRL YB-4993]|uniref:DASH complex subunit SPC19 n=1 Tax=Metschnikowia bicuspidata var. bicuspidata NRRL YB-4993 TaxID=869754 RepID=A0A1A0HCL0_9ASCO|nr:hypothetical protein METBIDRAFT_42656 [Metschnikowia bicuspidata var. bicuspidata NRRL YB-4993]OBA21627.1 hypothetical protein METBIDRAFT_42656 [Metschnikowia bicuspidata var. bicuspidata NRRL YB-4993]
MRVTARILRDSTKLLEGTAEVLDRTIQDIPRLQKVLDTEKLLGVVPDMDVRAAKESVSTEAHPQIEALSSLLEKNLAKLRRKKTSLESQARLLQVRLESAENQSPLRGERRFNRSTTLDSSHEADLARLRYLRHKSDRLSYNLSQAKLKNNRAKLSFVPSLPPAP